MDCIARLLSSVLDGFYFDGRIGSLRHAECSEVNNDIFYTKAGIGWEDSPDIEGVYLTLCLRLPVILQIHSIFWS